MRLAFTVDSVRDGDVYGRVTSYFAGDAGVDPALFGPLKGRLTGEDIVVAATLQNLVPVSVILEGALRGDTLLLRRFVLGPDTIPVSGSRLAVTRQRRPGP